jgi:ABC-type glycerol-3-phosphate transport system permease component
MRKQAVIMLVVLIFVALFCLFPRLFTFFTFTSNSDSLFGGGTVSVKQGDKDTAIAGAKHPLPLLNSALHQNGNLTKETETETEKEPATIALEEEEKIMVEQRDAMDTPADLALLRRLHHEENNRWPVSSVPSTKCRGSREFIEYTNW